MPNKPEATLFDGKTLPSGADEDWWGGPVTLDDPESGRTLNVPSRANQQIGGPFNTTTAKPGDMVMVFPAEGSEDEVGYKPAWGKVGGEGTALPPDDPAQFKDTQTEYLLDQAEKAGGMEDRIRPGSIARAASPRRGGPPAYDPSYQAPPAQPGQNRAPSTPNAPPMPGQPGQYNPQGQPDQYNQPGQYNPQTGTYNP
jgi:hypothetical protein